MTDTESRRIDHLERDREYSRRWKKANPEKAEEIRQRWRKANPEKVSLYRKRSYWRAKGIDYNSEVYHHEERNACDVCGSEARKIVTDHDHLTGIVRGRLCSQHNLAIGFFEDHPDLLRVAAIYLEATDPDPQYYEEN